MSKVRNLLILLCLVVLAVPVFAQDATPEATAMEMEYTVNLSPAGYMVGPNGMTLYTFDADALDTSNCNDKCATAWPPLTVDNASALTADESIPGDWGTITRADSKIQVTYNGQPLYYWFKDANPGDTTGEAVGGSWWIVKPATVYIQHDATLGSLLVGEKGMTVYMFKNDTAGSASTCTGDCAKAWPAVTVADEDGIVAGDNVRGMLGTIETADGKYQVTYNGWPLYTFAKDAKRGDTMGEGVGSKWYTLAPETVDVSKNATLGDILIANQGGKTVYTFKGDTAGAVSTCTGDCAKAWPAVTVGAHDRLVAGAGITGTLGTVATADGKGLQLTYNGMPLYTFSKDVKPGDANGQAVGDKWYVVSPAAS